MERLRLSIRGVVQGVGFRPFVHQLATGLGLAGWVRNSPQGVTLEVEGPRSVLETFLQRLVEERPAHSSIQSLETLWLDPVGHQGFLIQPSEQQGPVKALVLPDIATCFECLRELFDPADRRFAYPFINCTHCGPRYSIITALPYDRPHTTMSRFVMCAECRAEYTDPANRRFHAQPNACARCGPHLELWSPQGRLLASGKPEPEVHPQIASAPATLALIRQVSEALRAGAIVAVKGLGGFHLMVLARLEEAVQRLRQRKHRESKPFALMFPSLAQVQQVCAIGPAEARLLSGPEAPIVLLARRKSADPAAPVIAASVAPGNPYLGIMLPYTPLHHLLLRQLGEPVVATSGNLSDEPICTDEHEALERLAGIADLFLVHNRPIARHVDDSVVRIIQGREMLLRRARGYAPLPVPLPAMPPHPGRSLPVTLAVGAHLKNAIGLGVENYAFLSQHVGDLETEAAEQAFLAVSRDLPALYGVRPDLFVADLHPDYMSTRHARRMAQAQGGLQPSHAAPGQSTYLAVQHHLAHVLAVMTENEVDPPVLGVAWDGTGLGWDGTVWGGEFFLVTRERAVRVGGFRPFRLPGGDAAVREPRRTALGVLHALGQDAPELQAELLDRARGWFEPATFRVLWTMLERGLHSPWCGSVGRLFDAVAALAGLRLESRFEGQAAMELEFSVEPDLGCLPYPLPLREVPLSPAETLPGSTPSGPPLQRIQRILMDWGPLLAELHADLRKGEPVALLATRFHRALVTAVVSVARWQQVPSVVLGGGCFQNRWLLEWTIEALRKAGFRPYWPQRVPPNDGGIALGQLAAQRLGFAQPGPD